MFKLIGLSLCLSWSTGSLTLREAMKRAEAESPLLGRARAEREIVKARRVAADVLMPANPYVYFNLFGQSADGGRSFKPVYQLHVEQQIEIAGQRGLRQAEADHAIAGADRVFAHARVEVRARVKAAFTALSVAERRLEVANEQHTLSERLVEIVRNRASAGAASDVDVRLVEVEAGRVAAQLVAAEADVAAWASQLAEALGLPPGPLQIERAPRPPPPSESLEVLTERALAQRQELQVLEASQRELDTAVSRLRREVVPNPQLWFELMREPALLWVSGGIGIQIPVWRRHQGEIAQASAMRARADAELQVVRKQVVHDVARAVGKLKSLAAQLAGFDEVVVPRAEGLTELVTDGWRAGKYDLQRVVLSKREAQTAKQERLDLLLQYWLTWIDLERALGAVEEESS